MTYVVNTNYPDPIDRASELEMIRTEDAIRQVQLRNVQKQLPGPDGMYPSPDCLECGDEIPLGRLKAASNNILCLICAAAVEKRLFGR